ncbi:peptide deformylase [Amycolatopsis sp. CA-230715]|uniref:peptide deformylase n=1 Tax=Amycolatopsis sp. CA-230715 TaxID=2745196 RepID=UPI001C334BB7|nr:peptide deformylase [Amycolatopsis sp. CA-230715]QWF84007.1 Peptide deformylase [Amycolatopsis sp. CA-230715]
MTTAALSDLVDALLAGPSPAPIVTAGDPVLRQQGQPYDGQLTDDQFTRLIALMRTTMREAPGVGLAAPQIGVPLRVAVVEDPATLRPGTSAESLRIRGRVPQPFRVLVNPRYTASDPGSASFFEGCLSVPGWQAVTTRHERVRLRGQDEHGRELDEEVKGWPARIVQHETDHLDGVLYLDRAEIRSLSTTAHVLDRWADPTPENAARALGFSLPGTVH